ncbi:bifunctional glutamate N-acetyltransferase/amino-acid acetyltransferase ArgJ [Halovulum sp. GXIMD14793]
MAGTSKVSPLAPAAFPDLPPVAGVRFAATAAGVRYTGRTDVMVAEIAAGSTIAGVFTRSTTRAAPVLWCQDCLPAGGAGGYAFLVNSGNANAFTGTRGMDAVRACTSAMAERLGLPESHVFMSSTGVIGEALPEDRILASMDDLVAGLSADRAADAARAIMTTDTYPKGAVRAVDLDGVPVTLTGIAKGSGMIAPDMATMLVYLFTDAAIDPSVLQGLVTDVANETFNCITVDSDTSTSDSLLMAATGQADMQPIIVGDARIEAFHSALNDLMLDLAHQVVRDGEGATKFVEIRVTGASDDRAAHIIGKAIADSPLVKTAIAGEDPNWGRIVMAIGKAGQPADRDRLTIRFGDITVAENGWVSLGYSEDQGAAYMKAQEIVIGVDLGLGAGKATIWTCDLTHDYIAINADYRS